MKLAGHVARIGERRGVYRVLMGKPEGKRSLGRLRPNGKIILSWIFKNWDEEAWTGLSWLRIGTGSGRL
jgi:hypothetical protein